MVEGVEESLIPAGSKKMDLGGVDFKGLEVSQLTWDAARLF